MLCFSYALPLRYCTDYAFGFSMLDETGFYVPSMAHNALPRHPWRGIVVCGYNSNSLLVTQYRLTDALNCAVVAFSYYNHYESLSFKTLHYKEELHKEKKRNSISKDRNLLCFSCKDLEYSICDKSKTYTMSNRSGDRHCNKHECYRSNL